MKKPEFQTVYSGDFYNMMRRCHLKLNEAFFAIYLRGKYCYFNKPVFPLSDKYICNEINIDRDQLRKLRERLQDKRIIEYDTFRGRGKVTIYKMLDVVMAPYLKDKRGSFSVEKGVKIPPILQIRKGGKNPSLYNVRVNKNYKELEKDGDFISLNEQKINKEKYRELVNRLANDKAIK